MATSCPVSSASRHPSEPELIKSYLLGRITKDLSWEFIHDADVYTADPASLTGKFLAASDDSGEKVWYFFSPVRPKNVRGQRKARTLESGAGCWHSEAGTKAVEDGDGHRVGYRQFFSFVYKHNGRRIRTGWLMVELRLDRQQGEKKPSDLVLCKIYLTPRAPSSSAHATRRPDGEETGGKRKNDCQSPDEAPPVRQCRSHNLPEATSSSNVVTAVMDDDVRSARTTQPANSAPASSMMQSPRERLSYPPLAAEGEAAAVFPAESSASATRIMAPPYFVLPSSDYSRQEYKDTVERRYYTLTGEVPEDEVIERIISEGRGEEIMSAAVAEHGKGAVLAALNEIQDRHDAAREVERSLLELHQVFLDMAVIVEAQGEKINDIAHHVSNARDYVHSGNKELGKAREHQRGSRKCLCIGIILLLLLILIVIVPIATSLRRS
ncbi:hypothetical protein VPH35_052803 [Triticum aestivum]|uniref:NAC domain-containing protein n=2 Tax=Triticum TaxID=4564 RepID=A0A9R1S2Y0_TRITD|nr:unnamed protein product [Triticum aestivum]VAH79101.1 unnamed protein product [Triticum turgidum subsp. durum]